MIRVLNGIALLVAITLAVALYIAKTEAKSSQERLEIIQAQLAEERRQVNVLNVEIAHLEEPERLRALARRYLGLEPLDPSREIQVSDLPILTDVEEEDRIREDLLLSSDTGELALADAEQAGGPNR